MREEEELVSVITPAYNSSRYISETIESIMSQTYTNWELLITDDCSTDSTCSIVESYAAKDGRIKLFRMERNSGAGAARNRSIEASRGRYIAFCDSDDRWYPEKLEKQLSFMREKDCGLTYTSYMTCDESGRSKGIIVCKKCETLLSMKCDDGIGCLTAIYDTAKVGRILMPPIRKRQDWGLWLKVLLRCGRAYGMKEPLAIYRMRTDSLSRRKSTLIKYNIAVYREVLGWTTLRSYAFLCAVFVPTYIVKKIVGRYINR